MIDFIKYLLNNEYMTTYYCHIYQPTLNKYKKIGPFNDLSLCKKALNKVLKKLKEYNVSIEKIKVII